jgi:uncharacterized protein YkwD
MLKRSFLLISCVATLAAGTFAQGTYNFTGPATGEPARTKVAAVKASIVVNTSGVERAAFDVINQKRVDSGLSPLVWSDDLAQIARLHSHNMAEQNFFDHRDQANKLVNDRAVDAGLKDWRAIGENIAFNRGFKDPIEKAVELWLDSSGHRQNLMNPMWNETAVGVAVGPDGSYYFTQVFWFR